MKSIYIFFWVALTTLLISCSQRAAPSATVNYLSGDDGTVTMRCIGTGKSSEDAQKQAEMNCFLVLLFRGLPESVQKTPMIGTDEYSILKEHADYFDSFFKGKRYKTFLMSSITAAPPVRLKKKLNSLTVDTKINITSLRRDLENHGVIRKFGL
jgi:hypothetical protein